MKKIKSCKWKLSAFWQSSLCLNHGKVLMNWKLRLVIFAFRSVPQFSFNLMLVCAQKSWFQVSVKKCLRRMESINGEQLVFLCNRPYLPRNPHYANFGFDWKKIIIILIKNFTSCEGPFFRSSAQTTAFDCKGLIKSVKQGWWGLRRTTETPGSWQGWVPQLFRHKMPFISDNSLGRTTFSWLFW